MLWLTLFAYALLEIVRRRPQVIYCGQILETGWIGFLFKKLLGIPYILTLYGEEIQVHGKRKWTRGFLNLFLSHADRVAAITRFTADSARRHTEYKGPITIAYPGVDDSAFRPEPGASRTDSPTLITVGRLMKRKGHDTVLKALPQIRKEFPDLTYQVIGIGPAEDYLKRLTRELELDSCVNFLGRVPHEQVVAMLSRSHLFVHPNRELADGDVEGFGLVFLEANACGLPVIGGLSGGAPEAVDHQETGLLVDPNHPEEFPEAVITLLQQKELWLRMASAGPEWARKFSWQTSAEALWQLGNPGTPHL